MYKVLIGQHSTDKRPLVITEEKRVATEFQVQEYLLCGSCEGAFDRNGEKWMLTNYSRLDGTFLLQQRLLATKPIWQEERVARYAAGGIPDIDMDSLRYFACSVFWRAAVRDWRVRPTGKTISTELGPFLPMLRGFLLDKKSFPLKMALLVNVASPNSPLLKAAMLPTRSNGNGFYMHEFRIPGVHFCLAVGSKIPKEVLDLSTVPAAEGYIMMSPQFDRELAVELSAQLW